MSAGRGTYNVVPFQRWFHYPSYIRPTFQGKKGQVVLDQRRTVDKARLVKRLGALTDATAKAVSQRLVEMLTC